MCSIHIFGKAYFSSNSLLPADPSAYTVPSSALPSATSLTISSPSGPSQTRHKRLIPPLSFSRSVASSSHTIVHPNPSIPSSHKAYSPNSQINLSSRRDTRTAYTLDTAQCPDPTWDWVTPWMINMKTGTDEGGWRYNAWFRRKGWKAHAGTAGWGGWVRRREWVRLRAVKVDKEVKRVVEDEDEEADGVMGEEGGKGKGKGDVPRLGEKGVEVLLKRMGRMLVDREKLDAWERWLKDDGFRDTAQSLLADSEAVSATFILQSAGKRRRC